MRIADRHLGLFSVFLLLGLIILIAVLMVRKNQDASQHVTVFFDDMGSLQPEDPVTSRGYPIGKVGSVIWRDGKAVVELFLDEPMILRSNTKIRNENYSLMGQRRIEIVPTREGTIVGSDYVFKGEFEPGIAEAMHLMEQVRIQVIGVRDLIFLLSQGDSTQPSVQKFTEDMLTQTESLLLQVETIAQSTGPWIKGALNEANQLTSQVQNITVQTDTAVQKITLQGNQFVEYAQKTLLDAQQKTQSLASVLHQFENNSAMQAILADRELIDKLQGYTSSVRTALNMFDADGNLIITDLNGNRRALMSLSNVNYFGATAREKARKKAEAAQSEAK